MSSTAQLLRNATAKTADAAIAQARDPKFPWSEATIARVGNQFVKRAMGAEATLTLPPKGKTQKTPPKFKGKAARKVKPVKAMSAFLKGALAEAEALVTLLSGFTAHDVNVQSGNVVLEGYVATLGEPTIGKRGGVNVMATLKPKKGKARTYELSGKQALRLFQGGNCGTPNGDVLYTA